MRSDLTLEITQANEAVNKLGEYQENKRIRVTLD